MEKAQSILSLLLTCLLFQACVNLHNKMGFTNEIGC